MNQMGNHFGVGFRIKAVAEALQFLAQGDVVLDDAVVHDADGFDRLVRMRVGFARRAVGSPSGMGDAGLAGHGLGFKPRLQLANLAHRARAAQVAIVVDGQSGGVITPVLQGAQAGQQDRHDITLGSGGNDSTHG